MTENPGAIDWRLHALESYTADLRARTRALEEQLADEGPARLDVSSLLDGIDTLAELGPSALADLLSGRHLYAITRAAGRLTRLVDAANRNAQTREDTA